EDDEDPEEDGDFSDQEQDQNDAVNFAGGVNFAEAATNYIGLGGAASSASHDVHNHHVRS
ncbi:unnamed protein product, partial [Amoebophrya sp. A25]